MKICFECSEYPPGLHGGIGSLVQILARGLVKAGHKVRVVGLYPASRPGPEYEEDQGVKVWRLRIPSRRWGWLRARRHLFKTVQTWCQSGDVDLVEVPDWGSAAAGWPALPVPVVVRLSGSASFFSREMNRRPPLREFVLERMSIRRADFVCSNSRYIASRTQSVLLLRSSADAIIYTPVEVRDLVPGIARDPNAVVFAATLAERKGIISLVRAWPAVKKVCPDAHLNIWGKEGRAPSGGPMQAYLTSLLPAGLRASLTFHGHVPLENLLVAFQEAAVTVLPSYAEGFALTPLHAMAAGCPTVYSSRGSGPELIVPGETGLLVDPDRTEEIAHAITAVLTDRDLAHRMGAAGRTLVEQKFSWPVLRAVNEDFYRRCIEEFSRSRNRGDNQKLSLAGSVLSGGLWIRSR